MSGDGNTAIVGALLAVPADAWVFTRTGQMWSLQAELPAPDPSDSALSDSNPISISYDGNTLVFGADLAQKAWVYSRVNGVRGKPSMLAPGVGSSDFGVSVAISSDGGTIMVGADTDNNGAGAVWVYTRANGNWVLQGGKLVAAGAMGPALFGAGVALSADGNTAVIAGANDNFSPTASGAVWVFVRSNGQWSQQGV